MSDIIDVIKVNRPFISQSSLKTYQSAIRSLPLDKDFSPENVVKNADKIIDFLKQKKLNVRKTKLSALIVYLDSDKKSDETKKVIEAFRTVVAKDKVDNDHRELNQTLTERQQKNFITWDEVLKFYHDLKIEAEPLFKLSVLNIQQFRKLMAYVLLSCYVLIPPRRSLDWSEFKIRDISEDEDNYMKVGKKGNFFVFNQYKNVGRMGSQEIPIPTSLKTIITKWIAKNPYDYLICNSKGGKINQSKINHILNDIFQKNIGSTMLRHIYASHKYGNVNLAAITKDAEMMGQSNADRLLRYVNKDAPKLNWS